MKKKEIVALRAKKKEELVKLVDDKKKELVKIYSEVSSSKEKNLKKANNIRREIAQILTIVTESEFVKEEGENKAESVKKA